MQNIFIYYTTTMRICHYFFQNFIIFSENTFLTENFTCSQQKMNFPKKNIAFWRIICYT